MQTPSHGTPDDSLFEEELSSSLSPVFLLQKKARDARLEFNTSNTPQTPENRREDKTSYEPARKISGNNKNSKGYFFCSA